MSETLIKILLVLSDFSIIVNGFLMCFLKENGFVGFRTPTTLSNPYIWKNTNKHTGLMLVILGIVCFFPALSGNVFLFTLLLLIGSLGIFVFGLIYSNKLRDKLREKKDYTSNFFISRRFCYTMAIFSIFMVVAGFAMLFVPPNTWIGIRIPKTLTNPILWRNVNKISGVGFIVIGLIFALLFSKDALKPDKERSESFDKHNILFLSLTTLWALISIGIVYLF